MGSNGIVIGQSEGQDIDEGRVSKKRKTESMHEPREVQFKLSQEEATDSLGQEVEKELREVNSTNGVTEQQQPVGLSETQDKPTQGKSKRALEGEEEDEAEDFDFSDDGLEALSELITFELSQQNDDTKKHQLNELEAGRMTDTLLQSAIEALFEDRPEEPPSSSTDMSESSDFNFGFDALEKGDNWTPSMVDFTSSQEFFLTSSCGITTTTEPKDLDDNILELLLKECSTPQQPVASPTTGNPTESLQIDSKVSTWTDDNLLEDWSIVHH